MWLADLSIAAQRDGTFYRLHGSQVKNFPPLAAEQVQRIQDAPNFAEDAVWLIFGDTVLQLWPLALYGLPRGSIEEPVAVPQIYKQVQEQTIAVLHPVGGRKSQPQRIGRQRLATVFAVVSHPGSRRHSSRIQNPRFRGGHPGRHPPHRGADPPRRAGDFAQGSGLASPTKLVMILPGQRW